MRSHERDDYDECSVTEHNFFWAAVAVILTGAAAVTGLMLGLI